MANDPLVYLSPEEQAQIAIYLNAMRDAMFASQGAVDADDKRYFWAEYRRIEAEVHKLIPPAAEPF